MIGQAIDLRIVLQKKGGEHQNDLNMKPNLSNVKRPKNVITF